MKLENGCDILLTRVSITIEQIEFFSKLLEKKLLKLKLDESGKLYFSFFNYIYFFIASSLTPNNKLQIWLRV